MNELMNRTLIYCRLSKDDGINGDSSSIQTKKNDGIVLSPAY